MRQPSWRHIVLALMGLVVVWLVVGLLQSRSPDAGLTRVADRALAMAEHASHEARQARWTAGAVRLVALAVGVSAPLIAVAILARLLARGEPGPGELLDVLERQGLVELGRKELPAPKEAEKPVLPAAQEKNKGALPTADESDM